MSRILAIDDDQNMLDLYKAWLSEDNHELVTVTNALDASEFLNNYRFDLVIVDINMPLINGFKFVDSLKRSLTTKLIPVVFCSARNDKHDVEKALNLDASYYFIKPLEKKSFKEKLYEILAKSPARQALKLEIPKNQKHTGKLHINSEIEIESITEIGIDVVTDLNLNDGQIVRVESPIFESMGIITPNVKVFSKKKLDDDKFKIVLRFDAPQYSTLEKIRVWLLAQNKIK